MTDAGTGRWDLGQTANWHALAWLAAANAVGVVLAALLLWPAAGDWLAPLTYGRWVPVHLNAQLYGWCALPLVGALLAWYLDPLHPRAARDGALALAAWTVALAGGVVSWLAGHSSGKLFLDWTGWARILLPLAMAWLWLTLARHARHRHQRGERIASRGLLLAALLPVPFVFFWSTAPTNFPAINPDSGGATGSSLLGSTLGIVGIFALAPHLLGLKRRPAAPPAWLLWAAWLASIAVYAPLSQGDHSHHSTTQIALLGLLIAWIPLLPVAWNAYEWPSSATAWRRAATAWWAVLILTGWLAFLPGFSERWKFTNALVGHAHLAMAGFVTSANAMLLAVLGRGTWRCPRWAFWTWQLGTVAHVGLLVTLGSLEAAAPGAVFLSAPWVQAFYAGRLAAGAAMAAASWAWLASFR